MNRKHLVLAIPLILLVVSSAAHASVKLGALVAGGGCGGGGAWICSDPRLQIAITWDSSIVMGVDEGILWESGPAYHDYTAANSASFAAIAAGLTDGSSQSCYTAAQIVSAGGGCSQDTCGWGNNDFNVSESPCQSDLQGYQIDFIRVVIERLTIEPSLDLGLRVEVWGTLPVDCDSNGVVDACEPDCNSSGAADECDILGGASVDANSNRIPDECEDCNGNGIGDLAEIAGETSTDCNSNGLPDECDLPTGSESYRVTDIGTFWGTYSSPNAISPTGQVVGSSTTNNSEQHAFLWENGVKIDLGTMGGTGSTATGINSHRQVIGTVDQSGGYQHAFIWDTGVMTDLGTLGGRYSDAVAINNSGQVTGSSETSSQDASHAYLWSGGVMTDLGTLGGDHSYAMDINDAGQVVGAAQDSNGDYHPCVWEGGVCTDLGSLGGSDGGASRINSHGQIIGYSSDGSSQQRAFLYDNGTMTDLGTLGGSDAYPYAINDAGQIVGVAKNSSGENHAFFWSAGIMTDLGTLGGSSSEAVCINNRGDVIGYSEEGSGNWSSFLWRGGILSRLSDLIAGGSPWNTLETIERGINDATQIVGSGEIDGYTHAFLMTPLSRDCNANGLPDDCEAAPRLYVAAGAAGANNGASWADAYTDLQSALCVAAAFPEVVDEIWVAEGTYRPDTGAGHTPGDRDATFQLISGVVIYGGFAGTETELSQHDPQTHVCILSGDLAGDDPVVTENSYSVVTGSGVDGTAVLDGFTISGGNADTMGAGDPPTFNGGGVFIEAGSPTMVNCTIDGNSASNGGGLYCVNGSPALTDCDLSNNSAGLGAGAAFVGGHAILTDCQLTANTAWDGGGLYNETSPIELTRCTFLGNTATSSAGAGIYDAGGTPTLTDCDFTQNVAGDGAGIYFEQTPAATVTDCRFTQNQGSNGGAILCYLSNPTLTRCTLTGNTADQGGGVSGTEDSSPQFIDCTIEANEAWYGGGMYIQGGSPTFSGCTWRNNSSRGDGAGAIFEGCTGLELTNCLFDGNACHSETGSGFGGAVAFWASEATVTDCQFTGNSSNGPSGDHGGAGIHADESNATLSNCAFSGNTGGIGAAIILSNSSPALSNCTFSNNVSDNNGGAIAVTGSGSSPTLTDCTFTGNQAPDGGGGAIYSENAASTLTRCTFEQNESWGAGMYLESGSSGTLTDCTFRNNPSPGDGGGMIISGSDAQLTGCLFIGNSSHGGQGGGVAIWNSSPSLTSCRFLGNTSEQEPGLGDYGAAVVLESGSPSFVNCLFSGNTGGIGATFYINNSSNPTLINCTISGNVSDADCAGVALRGGAGVTITNSILWGNQDTSGMGELAQIQVFSGSATLNYSDVQGGWSGAGTNNISGDPRFVDADGADDMAGTEDDDLRFFTGSPCIDAADNTVVPVGVITDLAGEARFLDSPATIDTGNGTVPIVDMGAFESPPDCNANGWEDAGEAAARLYVDADAAGANNGQGWANAYTDLQSALCIAAANPEIVDEIWVADGAYRPDLRVGFAPGDRDATFQLVSGVAIYGGFAGTESELSERDPDVHVCILNGDINGDDAGEWDDASRLENIRQLVTGSGADSTAVLDGFTVRNGTTESNGPGLLCEPGHPTIARCKFVDHVSYNIGGAVYLNGSNPTFTQCSFENNSGGDGGGIMLNDFSNPVFTDCVFSGNTARSCSGGGILISNDSDPQLTRCSFTGNHAICNGGGAFVEGTTPVFDTCTFVSNTADESGGGMVVNSSGIATLTNCTFDGNTAPYGAGIYMESDGGSTLDGCGFTGNTGTNDMGGGIYMTSSSPSLSNCSFDSNTSVGGGGLAIDDYSDPQVTDCTFTGNDAAGSAGGAMFVNNSSNPAIDRCTFSLNTAARGGAVMCEDDAGPTLTDCLFSENSAPDGLGGGMCNNVSSPTLTGCTFSSNSARDGGGMWNENDSNPALTDCSFTGNIVVHGGGGMYNMQSSPTLSNCTFTSNSTDEDHGGGMYNDTYSNPVLIDCAFSGNVAFCDGGGIHNEAESNPTLTRCTFTGNSTPCGGGGMSNLQGCNPALTDCTFSSNSADQYGGGMANITSSPALTRCTFTANTTGPSATGGAGMYNYFGSSPTVTECSFTANTTPGSGAGMLNWESSSPTVTRCTFRENEAGNGGGAMVNTYNGCNPLIVNCTFIDNVAGENGTGGAMWNDESSPTLINCTFTGNSSLTHGGGALDNECVGTLTLTNCILWGNTPDEILPYCDGPIVVSYSDVRGGWPGTGNIDADPRFVFAANGDVRLLSGSPCIDAGDNDAANGAGLTTDLSGGERFRDDAATSDTGNGTPPIVDMGVYEYFPDCNTNGVMDALDIAGDTSDDDDGDGIPNECENDTQLILTFGNNGRAAEDCIQPGSGTNETLTVRVELSGAGRPITGGQFFMAYDVGVIEFVSATPGDAPFTREVFEFVDGMSGALSYAVGIENEGLATTADSTMAIITFRAVGEQCAETTLLRFSDPGSDLPPTRLSDDNDGEVLAALIDLQTITSDFTPPELVVPDDVSVHSDAGECQATFSTMTPAFVSDNCDQDVTLTFSRDDGKPNLLDSYEAADSPITITWTAEDDCGNTATDTQVITVSDQNEVLVDVELSPTLDDTNGPGGGATLQRCITFQAWECPGGAPLADSSTEVIFPADAMQIHRTNGVSVLLPCGVYTCLTARDALHTLRSTAPDFTDDGTTYSATYVGNRATGGHWLLQGNLNDDRFIDILDFGSFVIRFQSTYDSDGNMVIDGHTDCGTPLFHADLSGDGRVFTEDFTFIQINFLKRHEDNCCDANGLEAPAPVRAISVADLWRMGMGELGAADLNADGMLDEADMEVFSQRVNPVESKIDGVRRPIPAGTGRRSP